MTYSDCLAPLQTNFLLEAVLEAPAGQGLGLTHGFEAFLQEFALFLKIILEFIAICIVAVSIVTVLRKLLGSRRRFHETAQQAIRLELGLSLALSLEFLLAADIVGTAVSPAWDAIAKLAAITGIRTFLNFFLQKEVAELQRTESLSQQRATDSEL
ncbi:MAG TPA: DUF1622 domain-containing protein [Leptolyngbyaceae cyanobacterium M33_DOE_097]|uniref:DUF1622 domain-containing protein n=1 Tax=Oscillatoriales cyanobacterium SpSt-418 TaxID=2282169 RepID=A0A7C3KD91_9CYAN|nr:DUF1622 domain-containing protein [Leptolyngbyaceae cyanobacterium M33_DOE_097]